jgi:hypothetical protein
MGDVPRELLCSLIKQQGTSVICDPIKFRNLLNDFFKGQYKRERKCLSDSLLEDIPGTLLNKTNQLPYETISQQLCQKLTQNLGITFKLAKWTVDSWAVSLDIIREEDLPCYDYTFSIISNPIGARVSLDGILKGVTPLNLKNLELKTYPLVVSFDGYKPWIQSLTLDSRVDSTLKLNLIKIPAESGPTTEIPSPSIVIPKPKSTLSVKSKRPVFTKVIYVFGLLFLLLFIVSFFTNSGSTPPSPVQPTAVSVYSNSTPSDSYYPTQQGYYVPNPVNVATEPTPTPRTHNVVVSVQRQDTVSTSMITVTYQGGVDGDILTGLEITGSGIVPRMMGSGSGNKILPLNSQITVPASEAPVTLHQHISGKVYVVVTGFFDDGVNQTEYDNYI